jgi:Flp pilus assembly pilin Flp
LPVSSATYNLGLNRSAERSEITEKEPKKMRKIKNIVWNLRIVSDVKGQDLIEYALMAGFVAVAAGAIMPGIANSISLIFSSVASVMTGAASQGS